MAKEEHAKHEEAKHKAVEHERVKFIREATEIILPLIKIAEEEKIKIEELIKEGEKLLKAEKKEKNRYEIKETERDLIILAYILKLLRGLLKLEEMEIHVVKHEAHEKHKK